MNRNLDPRSPDMQAATRPLPDVQWNELLEHEPVAGRSSLAELLAAVRQNILPLLLWIGLCCGLTFLYLSTVKPQYVSSTQVVLEPRRAPLPGSDPNATSVGLSLDSAQAESQTQVVKSERILRFVFDTLNLSEDPAYGEAAPGLLSRITGLFAPSSTPDPLANAKEQQAIRAFQAFSNRVDVRRIGQSYVLEISFRADSPKEAVRLANAVTASYILDQVNFRAAAVGRGSEFLQNRIADIKQEQEAATRAVKDGAFPDQQFLDSDARIVSAAVEPLGKSSPRTTLDLLLAAILAAASGIGLVAFRRGLDRRVRSREQLLMELGVGVLTVLPRVARRFWVGGRLPFHFVLDQPDSPFARMLRVVRASLFAASLSRPRLAIGVTSCRAGEGRTTVAANLAHLLATTSDNVVLIDGELARPALSEALAPQASASLGTLIASHTGSEPLSAMMLTDTLAFVPAVAAVEPRNPNLFLGAKSFEDWFRRLRGEADVVIDLPALDLSSDTQAVGHLLDGVVLLVEIGRTKIDDVSEAMRVLAGANVRLLGLVLNKAPAAGRA